MQRKRSSDHLAHIIVSSVVGIRTRTSRLSVESTSSSSNIIDIALVRCGQSEIRWNQLLHKLHIVPSMVFPVQLGHAARVVPSLLDCFTASKTASTAVAASVVKFTEQVTHSAATNTTDPELL